MEACSVGPLVSKATSAGQVGTSGCDSSICAWGRGAERMQVDQLEKYCNTPNTAAMGLLRTGVDSAYEVGQVGGERMTE